jgi:hypothetical protein
LPGGWRDRPGPVYVAEGASDTAALHTAGACAIGRPSAGGAVGLLARLLAGVGREVVVVADRDADGRRDEPAGALALARRLRATLGPRVRCVLPPPGVKDVRDYFCGLNAAGGGGER